MLFFHRISVSHDSHVSHASFLVILGSDCDWITLNDQENDKQIRWLGGE